MIKLILFTPVILWLVTLAVLSCIVLAEGSDYNFGWNTVLAVAVTPVIIIALCLWLICLLLHFAGLCSHPMYEKEDRQPACCRR